MKKVYILLFAVIAFVFTSCSSDDNAVLEVPEEVLEGTNSVSFVFNHQMFGEDIVYDQYYKENSIGESLNITFLKYIVSNFVLIDEKGAEFTYKKDDSYFFVDSKTKDFKITLNNVPAGRYSKVKFGVGVDQEKYLRGMEDQQEFWDLCKEHDLIWGWITGYKFINCQGLFKTGGQDEEGFQLHIGSHGSKLDNYKEVLLKSPQHFVVSAKHKSTVHVDLEVSKLLDSTHKIALKESPYIMIDAVRAPKIMQNAQTMFNIRSIVIDKE